MKSVRSGRLGSIALFVGTVTLLFIMENGAANPPSPEKFSVKTKNFALSFEVGDDGRL